MIILPLLGIAVAIGVLVTAVVWIVTRGARRAPDPDMWRPGHDPLGPEGWAALAREREATDGVRDDDQA